MKCDSARIRETFLEFFASKQHEIVPSAPMVVKNDPTLMFTNAGMNQFKDIFLGNSEANNTRVADSQKCLRVSGKQNDLEEVGVDTYHHTMFEMLGNWSFGDYFKKEAIDWAWELLTKVYGIDKDRLYVTIFSGNEEDGVAEDAEARDLWKAHLAEDRILGFDKKDNFWEMGDVGPCGPCSEIHVDVRSEEERNAVDGRTLVNKDHPQVIEIWNLVFMQLNRMADGSLVPLPAKHVDTGMGFERLAAVLQGKRSNYDTDVFSPLIKKVEEISGITYSASDSKKDVAIRVAVDHIRAISFSIADGQLPSNTGAGYVIRRILRRAIRYGYSFLNLKEAFLNELVPVLGDQLGKYFPELPKQLDLVQKVIREEEESFLRTLERGIQRFNEYQANHQQVKGDFAFELYDTYGFPIDLTQLMAAEQGLTVDIDGFRKALEVQKSRSRKATAVETGDWVILREDDQEEFIGYDYTDAEVYITKYRTVSQKGKELVQLVFNLTPFYAEGGGQVGDTGIIAGSESGDIHIVNTKKENALIVHFASKLPSNPSEKFVATVNTERRNKVMANHSATHLMHHALREVLGTHVEQKGSLVHPDYLRFDFSHFQKVSPEEIRLIEKKVNALVRNNHPLNEQRAVPIKEAEQMGAMALFGEKYGDLVRVIQFGDSVELCGGTHVPYTGNIGLFRIISESSVAAGIRRIEAVTGETAEDVMFEKVDLLDELGAMMRNTKNVKRSIEDLITDNQSLQFKIGEFQKHKAQQWKSLLTNDREEVNGMQVVMREVDVDQDSIKNVLFQLKGELDNSVFVVAIKMENKITLSVAVSDDLVKGRGVHAGNMVREMAKEVKGGGGGQPFFATAGGKDPNNMPAAFEKGKSLLNEIK
jgi:alanyl-tRNA synthetase